MRRTRDRHRQTRTARCGWRRCTPTQPKRWAAGTRQRNGSRRRIARFAANGRWTSWTPTPASAKWKIFWGGLLTASIPDAGAVSRMKIWRICREPYAVEAFSGEGARRFGGRWNSRGVPMIYASVSLALAALELFVNLEPGQAPEDLVYLAATLP